MYEVEIKLPLNDFEGFISQLDALTFIEEEVQIDTYYNHPCRNFVQTDEALRIRVENGIQKITYKGPKLDSKSKSRKEIEFNVENDKLSDFLSSLGFFIGGKVEKTRRKWKSDDVLICLDDVKGLGTFVELETEVNKQELIGNGVEKLYQFAQLYGLDPNQNIRESYLELILQNEN